jgi:hypothetical protein
VFGRCGYRSAYPRPCADPGPVYYGAIAWNDPDAHDAVFADDDAAPGGSAAIPINTAAALDFAPTTTSFISTSTLTTTTSTVSTTANM